MRDFIKESLYDPKDGYFSSRDTVGTLPNRLDYGQLMGQNDYMNEVAASYAALGTRWLTPAEIFSPHYGGALARWVASIWRHRHGAPPTPLAADALAGHTSAEEEGSGTATESDASPHPAAEAACTGASEAKVTGPAGLSAAETQMPASVGFSPLRIYEIGGGTGTLALDVLDWLAENDPEVYAVTKYVSVEISATLAGAQRERLRATPHSGRWDALVGDASSPATWGARDASPCVVLACEVLDNLPHDKAVRADPRGRDGSAPQGERPLAWREVRVKGAKSRDGNLRETHAPLSDDLLIRALRVRDRVTAERDAEGGLLERFKRTIFERVHSTAWVPTGALRLFDALHAARPNHLLFAADFDELPEVVVRGEGAPLVATTRGGQTLDHVTYLVPRGSADIFFPSDFELLAQLYRESAEVSRERHAVRRVRARTTQAGTPAKEANAQHEKSGAFFERWTEPAAGITLGGYRPIVEDYSNTSVLVAGDEEALATTTRGPDDHRLPKPSWTNVLRFKN